jgi:hypothetical protein
VSTAKKPGAGAEFSQSWEKLEPIRLSSYGDDSRHCGLALCRIVSGIIGMDSGFGVMSTWNGACKRESRKGKHVPNPLPA